MHYEGRFEKLHGSFRDGVTRVVHRLIDCGYPHAALLEFDAQVDDRERRIVNYRIDKIGVQEIEVLDFIARLEGLAEKEGGLDLQPEHPGKLKARNFWALLINQGLVEDPLLCPSCGGEPVSPISAHRSPSLTKF